MRPAAIPVIAALAFATGFACSLRDPVVDMAGVQPVGATLLDGLGTYQRKVTTSSPAAQRWFDQGLMLSYGFNHDAAERSFLKAIEADPKCAMCWWGAALVLGPHVNATMDPANNDKAWARAQRAQQLAKGAAPWEQVLIRALTARYAQAPPQDRKPLDLEYAKAMMGATGQLPQDLDAATLYAEALMDVQPWNYWDRDGQPLGYAMEIAGTLESVLERNPDHPGALHLYIHAVEASSRPEAGAAAADRLRELVPGSGHLVHMPAHIYTRVGRYHDAAVANQKAIAADDSYLASCRPAPGVYPLGYVPHNHHFLWWASSMEGASATALAAAEETARRTWLPDLIASPGYEFLQDFWVTPLKAKVQFGRWDEIVATPRPPENLAYPVAIWNFAQGMAAARQKRVEDGRRNLEALAKAAADPVFETYMLGPQHAVSRTLKVGERLLAGELALAGGKRKEGLAALEQAVALEDGNAYFEPPLWHQPARQFLGRALLAAGKAREAERVYREDLRRNRGNGWSLWGLTQSLRAQKKTAEAAKVEKEFRAAWKHADVKLAASAF